MSDFPDFRQRQSPYGELIPRVAAGPYGAPAAPYVPADPPPYPENVLEAMSQIKRKPGAVRAFLRRLFARR